MKQIYLCHKCCELLELTSNEIGVNEAGRKNCYGCGCNQDWSLHVEDQEKIDPLIAELNAKTAGK